MDYGKVLRRAWDMVWRHRALWLLGALLALTTVNGVYVGWDWNMDRDELGRDVVIKVNERSTIYLPGEGLSVDLSAPGGATVTVDGTTVTLSELFTETIPREVAKIPWMEVRTALDDVSAILIAMGVVLATVVLVSIVVRYTSEAGLIRAVNAIEESSYASP